ncbi:MAG: polysaccharide deacetylase family protein [Deltaproteobacteria bacterium]|nr:polysaccharide deacetylase family protein [Deltaproteobacteria bacterium]
MTPRWIVKRGLKWAVEWGMACSGLGFIYRRTPRFRNGYRILTYHKISKKPSDSHGLSTVHFEEHMKFLADTYPVIGLGDLVKRLIEGPVPEKHSVAVTFDDGYHECGAVVRKVLDRFGIPATFFVITGILDENFPPQQGPYLTWQGVRELHSAGFSIGSHATHHVSLGDLELPAVQNELCNSWSRLLEELGTPASGLAYPYGTMRDFSPAIADIARKVGYQYAVTAIHGLNQPACDPFTLRRTTITAGDGLSTFRRILKGDLDPWALVDRWAYRLQRPHAE